MTVVTKWDPEAHTYSVTDGTRSVSVQGDKYSEGQPTISVCQNGYQTTTVGLSQQMLVWLADAIDEYLYEDA